jgi:predicted DNA-binding transcriptional regulator AlpA
LNDYNGKIVVDRYMSIMTNQPPTTLLRKKEIIRRVGVDPSTLWQWIRAGDFPMPVVINVCRVRLLDAAIR